MLVLIGILIIIAGFLLRFNPLLVIMASALATGLAAGLDPIAIVAAFNIHRLRLRRLEKRMKKQEASA